MPFNGDETLESSPAPRKLRHGQKRDSLAESSIAKMDRDIMTKVKEVSDQWQYPFKQSWVEKFVYKPLSKKCRAVTNAVLIGSSVTGIALKGSDLDVAIIVDYESRVGLLAKFRKILESVETIKSIESISAKVPILRFLLFIPNFIDPKTRSPLRFQVELSIVRENERHVGALRNTHLLSCYVKLSETAKNLAIVIKHWAKHHCLLDTLCQRLNGYGIVLLVIFYLQGENALPVLQQYDETVFNTWIPVIRQLDYDYEDQQDSLENCRHLMTSTKSIGEHLEGFFRYYANFNWLHRAISVRTGRTLPAAYCQERAPDPRDWNKHFHIEDPFNGENVARCAYNARTADRIKEAFSETWNRLFEEGTLESIFY